MPFSILQDTIPVNPPNGNSTYTYVPPSGGFGGAGVSGWVALGVILAVVFLYIVWEYLNKRQEITHTDIMPTLDNLDSEGVSINTASLVQMIMVIPALGAFIWASMEISRGGDSLTIGAIAFAVIAFQLFVIAEARRRTREKYSGMMVMTGWMRTKDGTKRKYYWRNVEILTERRLPDEDYELLSQQTDGVWTKERLYQAHIYPFIIDNKGACYVITSAPKDVAFEWVKGTDWDYFGDFKIVESGPELQEVAVIHRVTNDYTEGDDESFVLRDEYIRVFVTAWDDERSVQYRAKTQSVDITRDAVIGQIAVALGVQSNITAGMINADRQTLLNVLNDQKKLDVMAGAIGSGLAAGIIEDKEALGTLDKIGLDIDWLEIIKYVVIFAFGVIFGVGVLG